MERARKQRILTGVGLGVILLVAIFAAPSEVFFLLSLAINVWAAWELVRICRHWTPDAPLGALLVLVPIAAAFLAWMVRQESVHVLLPLALAFGLVLLSALIVLWSETSMEESVVAIGFLTFGVPYFAPPSACLYSLHRIDPWLVLLCTAIVAFGDSAAYFVGTWIGRHKMARWVSPKKSWEGSIAGGVTAMLIGAAWSFVKYEELRYEWLVVAAATAAAAQLGDLIESLIKRGAGVKDSSQVLPGHGGIWDRTDALLLAAPVFLFSLWALGLMAPAT